MNTLELLKAGKVLIDTPEKWTKEAYGKDKDGQEIFRDQEHFRNAVSFCSVGALLRAMGSYPGEELSEEGYAVFEEAQMVLCHATGNPDCLNIAQYNDNSTHEEVLAVWDRAIAEMEKKN